jgi:hypothetical protein
MNMAAQQLSPSDLLASQFLEKAKGFQANVELIRVLKSRTYHIGEANVLVRASSEGNRRYFFGINYITVEEIANLDNSFIAFICGKLDQTIFMPTDLLVKYLPQISHDRNGEYKINFDRDLNFVLKGRGQKLSCKEFLNNWNLFLKPGTQNKNIGSPEESIHTVIQGRLIEIGNIRGYETFCPNKSRLFNKRKISEITTVPDCPNLQFSEYNILRQIDVLWFRRAKDNFFPEYAFEVELTTGFWSGIGRLSTLRDYSSTKLYVVSNQPKKFTQVMSSFEEFKTRFKHVETEDVGILYSAELRLRELRGKIDL